MVLEYRVTRLLEEERSEHMKGLRVVPGTEPAHSVFVSLMGFFFSPIKILVYDERLRVL